MSIDPRPIANLTDPEGYVKTVLSTIQKKYSLIPRSLVSFLSKSGDLTFEGFKNYIERLPQIPAKPVAPDESGLRTQNRIKEIETILGDFHPETILDIGYGDATITESVASKFSIPREKTFGIDIIPIKSDRLTVLTYGSDGVSIPLPSKSVNLVMMNMSLHHIERRDAVLNEVNRVLSDDGILLIREHDLPLTEPTRGKFLAMIELVHWAYAIVNNTPPDPFSVYLTRNDLTELLKTHGFIKTGDLDLSVIYPTAPNRQLMYYAKFIKQREETEIDERWLGDLRVFLEGELQTIVPGNKELIDKLLSQENMKAIWAKAFTHELYDPEFNYEELEFLGDMVLKLVFPDYVISVTENKGLTRADFTEINIKYMSKETQAQMATKLGLSRFLRIKAIGHSNMSINGDLFESFFGALYTVGNNINLGVGFILARKMIERVMSDRPINESAKTNPKTQVQQSFSRFGLEIFNRDKTSKIEIRSAIDQGDRRVIHKVDITLTPEIIGKIKEWEKLGEMGLPIKPWPELDINPIIGSGTGNTVTVAEINAYRNALANMEQHGLNLDTIEQIKTYSYFASPQLRRYAEALAVKKRKDGILRFKFFIPSKTSGVDDLVVELLGQKPDGKWRVCSWALVKKHGTGPQATQSAQDAGRIKVIESYLAK